MPLYEYHCRRCGRDFELLRRMQDADSELQCPKCRSKDVERLVSAFATGNCKSSKRGFS